MDKLKLIVASIIFISQNTVAMEFNLNFGTQKPHDESSSFSILPNEIKDKIFKTTITDLVATRKFGKALDQIRTIQMIDWESYSILQAFLNITFIKELAAKINTQNPKSPVSVTALFELLLPPTDKQKETEDSVALKNDQREILRKYWRAFTKKYSQSLNLTAFEEKRNHIITHKDYVQFMTDSLAAFMNTDQINKEQIAEDIRHGANVRDAKISEFLLNACKYMRLDISIFKLLINAGAQVSHEICIDDEKTTLLKSLLCNSVTRRSNATKQKIKKQRQVIEILMHAGAKLNCNDIPYGRNDIFKLFLAAGADPNTYNRSTEGYAYDWPLSLAATSGSYALARLVLVNSQVEADLDIVDPNGRTVLMMAAMNGHEDIVELLLAAGANPRYQSEHGETALTLTGNNTNITRMLQEAIEHYNEQERNEQQCHIM